MAGDLVARGGDDLDAARRFAKADHRLSECVGGLGQRRGGAFHCVGGVDQFAGSAGDDLAGFVEPLVMDAERLFRSGRGAWRDG